MRRQIRPAIVLSLLLPSLLPPLFASLFTSAFTSAALAGLGPDDSLPLDPQVRQGKLDNGLRYLIRRNPKPEARAELRLVVDAGSVLEEDDQQGLAHFLEHMAFNGTEHFAQNELVNFLESIGSKFGPDLNAYTSFDETVYKLEIPTDRDTLLEKGFLVLADWAHGMTLNESDIDKERGVVLEEWRLGRGAQERLLKIHWPVLLRGSRYAERLPIGQAERIEHAPPERLRAFYDRWYRPDLMGVVAVGDFDVDAVENLIRTHFGDIPRPGTPADRPTFEVPSHTEMLASSATDKEMPYTQVAVAFKSAPAERGTVRAFRRDMVEGLVGDMLNARLDEIRQKPDAPFLMAFAAGGSFLRRLDMVQVFAFSLEGGVENALTALMTEVARVREHGFGPAEIDRAKARLLTALEREYNEREKTESAAYAGEYVAHLLEGKPIPGIAVEYDLGKEALAQVTAPDVALAVARVFREGNTVIQASGPEKDGVTLPDAPTLVRLAREAGSALTVPYADTLTGSQLLARLPEPGRIVARRHKPSLGVTVLELSNGVEVWLKPTDFKNDQVLFGARVRGGKSLIAPEDYLSASSALGILNEGGLGGYTPSDLQKLLAGKIASVSPVLQDYVHGFSGSSTPRDFETALQLLYLYVTAPNDRADAFTVFMDRTRELVRNRLQSPDARFGDAVVLTNFQNHYMYRPLTLDALAQIDQARARAAYRRLFDDVSGYRFYVVGAFDPAAIEPLIERYLASLPTLVAGSSAGRAAWEFADRQVRFPEKAVEKTVRAGTDPKGTVILTWPANTGLSELGMFHIRKANDVLEIRLRELLREELGSTYSVSVGYSGTAPCPGYETTSISFGCDPDKAATLVPRVLAEVEKFKAEGPTPQELAKVKEIEIRDLEEGLERNEYWLSSFLTLETLRWDPERILARRERVETMTADQLQAIFAANYPRDRFTAITRLPENGESSGSPD